MSSVQYLIGKTLGKHQVLEHIGHGGMSEVYKGQQTQLNRMVAIKVLHPFLADEEGFVVRFQREARIVATLRHPNIVQVYDFDYNDDLAIYYMVMEYIDGPTLKNLLERTPLSPENTIHVGTAIADALDYAHQRGMVHRDIKPANIMFLNGTEPVLTDFGIARMLTLSGLTASGAMVGTPAYMAPEIGTGQAGTAHSDIYSLSVVLYQAVTGTLPFNAETPMGMVMEHINKEAPRPSLFMPEIPGALEQIILRGLEKDPADRFRTAGEMATALRQLMDPEQARQAPTLASEASTYAIVDSEAVLPVGSGEKDGIGQRGGRRANPSRGLRMLRALLLAVGLALAVLIVGSGVWFGTQGKLPPALHNLLYANSTGAQPVISAPFTSTPTLAPSITPTPGVTATSTDTPTPAPSPTPAPACTLRVKLDQIRIEPGAEVAPGTSVVAYITLRNSGKCAWGEHAELRQSDGDLLGAPTSFPIKALAPGESVQILMPLHAPEALGTYQSVWEMYREDGTTFGTHIPVELIVADVPASTATPVPPVALEAITPAPLTLMEPLLLSWDDDPLKDRWSGVVVVTAEGGSGTYRYYHDEIRASTELEEGRLAFEARRCDPFAFSLWVLSGEQTLNWHGEIPFPAPEACP